VGDNDKLLKFMEKLAKLNMCNIMRLILIKPPEVRTAWIVAIPQASQAGINLPVHDLNY
jgi:hypothetical protein